MRYLVLIADIVGSKSITRRDQTQSMLSVVLSSISKNNPGLRSPYTITLGDEFQAVFSRADTVFHEAMQILAAVYPVKVRFSLGVGEIITPINDSQALGMDGPAFYYARNGINRLKTLGGLFTVEGLDGPCRDLIQESLSLVSYTCRNWNHNRLKIFTSMVQKADVQTMAGELHISSRAIYKNIADGNLENIQKLLDAAAQVINRSLP